MIKGVKINPQKIIDLEGGDVMHAMKSSDLTFKGFGEAYFSMVKPNTVKAWKMHTQMTLNLLVPIGKVRFVLISNSSDLNDIDNYQEVTLSKDNYSRLTVSPDIWFGFQGLSKEKSIVLNIADIEHNPDEVIRKNIKEMPFKWEKE